MVCELLFLPLLQLGNRSDPVDPIIQMATLSMSSKYLLIGKMLLKYIYYL